jgi:hypothetical protein
MTSRAFAFFVCLAASLRWPRLRYVAASIACEAIADEFASVKSFALALIMWLAPSLVVSSIGFALATKRGTFVVLSVACQAVAYTLVNAHQRAIAIVAAMSCTSSSCALIRSVLPGDVERSAMLAMLVGNAATFAIMALIGIDDAYASGAIYASNTLTHIAVSGLILWAMRR